ncbi:hypothetical protein GUJ93_ZPchr0008g11692 [Zizania palustris]|uniref:Uncharacterized protein n=1 Tax=Zizania palustris TaxID=103762 RepID=A0A8J5QXE5_ZIZPA|nr:hypothetical protein GUJ93_ZPchr0008g11692 [Zizania palustris]
MICFCPIQLVHGNRPGDIAGESHGHGGRLVTLSNLRRTSRERRRVLVGRGLPALLPRQGEAFGKSRKGIVELIQPTVNKHGASLGWKETR